MTKTARQLQGDELNRARFDGVLRLTLISDKYGPLQREVAIAEVWDDEETFTSYCNGLKDMLWDAVKSRKS